MVPTAIVVLTVFWAVLMMETVPLRPLVTYAYSLFGVNAIPLGAPKPVIVVAMVLVAIVQTETELLARLVTEA